MDFRQIEAYVKVIELAGFSKAAEAMFLSQPSVSTYINNLEKELGTKLINRSTKEVSPTLAGQLFYADAKELLARKENAVLRMRHLSGDLSGDISILASTVPSQYILPEMLARFRERYPDISFHVRQADTLEVARGIAAQRAEIGFSGGIIGADRCEFRAFMTEAMVLIAPCGKGFSESREYSLGELLYEYPYIAREKGSGTRAEYEAFFAAQGIDLGKMKNSVSFDNTQSIINAVAKGLGISVVSVVAAREAIERGAAQPLRIGVKLPERKFYYVRKRQVSHSHLTDLFVSFLEEAYPQANQ
ncbi:MAG: selenium metabolism-associated LysR family transcriptional regulator [Oscillospiraceae bacterium]|nr:selenium metabolism-associated LysR family transcriptional regulator [Oscillospiraceae bacterium]